nr:MAG TPA: Protein of unknown function (DUF1351) [Caudoviricetes sp.]
MELRILSPMEDGFVKKIEWNNEELKEAISAKVQDYKGLQYTEETIKEAKKDKATLNKLREAIETERKRIKKQCMAPYELFEKQVKEVLAIIDEPIQLIDSQIKEVEEQRRLEKKQKVLEIYEENIGNLKGILPFAKVFKNEYLNVSKSLKSITEEITVLISKVNQDMDVIEELDTKYELQVKDMYVKTLDLSMALRENARLEEVERKLAERRAQQERERAEAEKRAAAEAQKRTEAQQQAAESIPEKSDEKETVEEAQKETAPDPQTVTLEFRVTATPEQLQELKEFLKANNIVYGPVRK